jgi:hypothetical protein
MQALILKLLESSPDLLVPELAAYEIGQIDARIEAVREKIGRAKSEARKTELYARLGKLHTERDQVTAGPWVRTVLYRMAIDRYRTEANRARIIRKHAAELADKYKSGTGPSAEAVVMRKLEDEDVRARILRLPPKLAADVCYASPGAVLEPSGALTGPGSRGHPRRAGKYRQA